VRPTRLVLPGLVAAFLVALSPVAASGAQPYPPPVPVVTVSPGTVVVGECVEVAGTGFAPGEQVDIVVTYQAPGVAGGSQSVSADASGEFGTCVTLDRAGTAIITATGARSGRSGSATVTVLLSRDALPTTGTDRGTHLRTALAGLGAVLMGGLVVALTVRRRRTGPGLGS
jgi:hypothetical protein